MLDNIFCFFRGEDKSMLRDLQPVSAENPAKKERSRNGGKRNIKALIPLFLIFFFSFYFMTLPSILNFDGSHIVYADEDEDIDDYEDEEGDYEDEEEEYEDEEEDYEDSEEDEEYDDSEDSDDYEDSEDYEDEESDDLVGSEEESEGSGKKMVLIIAIPVVLILIVVGVIVFLLMKKNKAKKQASQAFGGPPINNGPGGFGANKAFPQPQQAPKPFAGGPMQQAPNQGMRQAPPQRPQPMGANQGAPAMSQMPQMPQQGVPFVQDIPFEKVSATPQASAMPQNPPVPAPTPAAPATPASAAPVTPASVAPVAPVQAAAVAATAAKAVSEEPQAQAPSPAIAQAQEPATPPFSAEEESAKEAFDEEGYDKTVVIPKDQLDSYEIGISKISSGSAASKKYSGVMTDEIIIGRAAHVEGAKHLLTIKGEKTVSTKHCAIRQENGKFYIRDLGSTNGTFVNGKRIKEETEINPNDVLKLGLVEFKVGLRKKN